MSYYTDFALTADFHTDKIKAIIEDYVGKGVFDKTVTWYDHQEDLGIVSEQFPLTLMTLHCKGEDGKEWRVYAIDGQTQRVDGVMTFAPCTLEKPQVQYTTVNVVLAGIDIPIVVEHIDDLTEDELYTLAKEQLKRLL